MVERLAEWLSELPEKVYAVMLFGAVGGAVGAAIMLFPAVGLSEAAQYCPLPDPPDECFGTGEFIKEPQFIIWLLLISAVPAFAAIVTGPLISSLLEFKELFFRNKREISFSILIALLSFSAPILVSQFLVDTPKELPLPDRDAKIWAITALIFVPSSLAVAGIWLVHAAARAEFKDIQPTEAHLERYGHLRERLQGFLWTLGAIIGLITLATGALREIHIELLGATEDDWPSALVLAYGAYFTVLVALVYFPAHAALLAAGRDLRDFFARLPSPNSSSWADTLSKRKDLEELLQLRVTTQRNFQTSFAILAPLLGGITTVLLGAE